MGKQAIGAGIRSPQVDGCSPVMAARQQLACEWSPRADNHTGSLPTFAVARDLRRLHSGEHGPRKDRTIRVRNDRWWLAAEPAARVSNGRYARPSDRADDHSEGPMTGLSAYRLEPQLPQKTLVVSSDTLNLDSRDAPFVITNSSASTRPRTEYAEPLNFRHCEQ